MRPVLAFLAAWVILAHSPDDLKRRYGGPASETFVVSPGIGVTVRRTASGAIAEMLVAPINRESLISSRQMTFTKDSADTVIEELVPKSRRGKLVMGTFLNSICLPENDCGGGLDRYEKVTITYISATEAGKIRYADIEFKT